MKQHAVKFVKFIIGWPLSIVAIIFLVRFITTQTHHLTWELFHPNFWVVALAICAFLVYFLFRSIFWQRLLKARGYHFSLQETTFLWSASELQRYIPGNIWSIVQRTVVFEKKGVDKKTTATLWLHEAEFLCISALILSLSSINFVVYGLLPTFPLKTLLVSFLILATCVAVVCFVYNRFVGDKVRVFNRILPPFSAQTNIWLLLLMISAFWCFGVGTYLSIVSFTALYPHDFNTFVGFFVLSYLAGYVSFIFPMGLGPREGIMTYGLSKYITVASAGIGALFSRLVLITSEIIFLIIAFVWHKIPAKKLQKLTLYVTTHKYFLLTLLFMVIYITYFTTASFLRYDNFYTGRFDLGNMDQTVWNTVHGRIFQLTNPDGTDIISRLSIHADYILVFLAPFYLLWQDPRMLLLIQVVVTALGALFVYLLAKKVLQKDYWGLVFAFLYLLNPSLEHSILYDFHGVVLATTFLLGAFYFLKTNKTVWFLLFLVLAGITKEEVWIVVVLLGLYAWVLEKRKWIGALITVCSSIIFYLIFFKAIPAARHGQHFALTFYSDFGSSPTSIFRTIFLSPQKTIATILTKDKLTYLWELLLPFSFLSLLSPILLIFLLPDLGINLLSNNKGFHEIFFQYTAVITPFLCIAAIYGLKKVQIKFPHIPENILIAVVVGCSILSAHWFGPLPIAKRPNVDMFWLQQPNKQLISNFLASIPHRYSIAATNNIGSHLSHRQRIYTIPTGIDEADILVFLLNDKFAQPSLKAQIAMTVHLRNDSRYVEVIHVGDFVVFEKKTVYPHAIITPRPNSLFPVIIRDLQQTFNNKSFSTQAT